MKIEIPAIMHINEKYNGCNAIKIEYEINNDYGVLYISPDNITNWTELIRKILKQLQD